MTAQEKLPGLSPAEAKRRLEKYGANRLSKVRKYSALSIFVSQFTSPLIYILLIAAAVSFALGEMVDAGVILAAVVLNTILGFWQEYRAEQSLEKLQSVLSRDALVVRGGERVSVSADELVPGDVVQLESGVRVPADGVLVAGRELRVNEAVLTGESRPVQKQVAQFKEAMGETEGAYAKFSMAAPIKLFAGLEQREEQERDVSVYSGTTVLSGSGVMIVVHTGDDTEVGAIAAQLKETERDLTPLQKRLAHLSNRLAIMVGVLGLLIMVVGYFSGETVVEMFTLAVAIAVSAIPEGLVVSLTAILAVGMQRILKRKALVRRLVAAEVLGSVTVICSDKTGTITQERLEMVKVVSDDEPLMRVVALVTPQGSDPLEEAMAAWVEKQANKRERQQLVMKYQRLDRLPFDSERKYSVTLTKNGAFMTGAPEVVMQQTTLSATEHKQWHEQIHDLASQGYRLIGVSWIDLDGDAVDASMVEAKKGRFMGLFVFQDSVRKSVAPALKKAAKAGIGVKVITGDFAETAQAVMRQVGLSISKDEMMSGAELKELRGMKRDRRVMETKLFYRTSPAQKLTIVEALKHKDAVVAMTGDGVNDAPALKKADIGIVVSSASDVSKETADMVLLDDNFGTIIAAVEEGRGIFQNLRKVILYLLADAFNGVLLVLSTLVLGLPLPVTAVQILWINLVADGFPTLALTVDPFDADLLSQPPRSLSAPLLDREIKILIGLISSVSAASVFALFMFYWDSHGLEYARTVAFATLTTNTLLYVFASRSLRKPVWKAGIFTNKWLVFAVGVGFLVQLAGIYVPILQRMLETEPLALIDWGPVLLSSAVVIVVIEVVKVFFYHQSEDE